MSDRMSDRKEIIKNPQWWLGVRKQEKERLGSYSVSGRLHGRNNYPFMESEDSHLFFSFCC